MKVNKDHHPRFNFVVSDHHLENMTVIFQVNCETTAAAVCCEIRSPYLGALKTRFWTTLQKAINKSQWTQIDPEF